MSIKRNRLMPGLLVLGLAASGVAACGGDSGSSDGKSWRYAITEPGALAPGMTNDAQGLNVGEALYDRLTTVDKTGKLLNNEAESIESKDQQTWTIKVKAGKTFHNGEPVTAQNYVDAWNAAAYGPNGWDNNYYFGNIDGYDALNPKDPDGDEGPKKAPEPKTKEMSGLKVVDPQTFTVKLSDPFSQFPLTLSFIGFAPVPKAALASFESYNKKPIGNGPFQMDGEWKPKDAIKVKKYDGYKGIRPAKSDGIEYKIFTDGKAQTTALTNGKADFVPTIPADDVPRAKRQLGKRFVQSATGTMDYLEIPLYDKRFQNVELRKAISMAIDRDGIVQQVFNGAYKPTGTIVAPLVKGYRAGACGETCTLQPDKAKAALKKAGGFEGEMVLGFSGANPVYEKWMQAVANQLKTNLGIEKVTFDKVPTQAAYLDKNDAKKMKGPYRANWIMDYASAENYLTTRCEPDNRNSYKDKECMDLITKGNSAKTEEEAVSFYNKAEDVLLRDLPTIPLWNWQNLSGYSSKVDSVNIDQYIQSTVRVDEVTVK